MNISLLIPFFPFIILFHPFLFSFVGESPQIAKGRGASNKGPIWWGETNGGADFDFRRGGFRLKFDVLFFAIEEIVENEVIHKSKFMSVSREQTPRFVLNLEHLSRVASFFRNEIV